MPENFPPSPRPSKRRRTGTYGTERTIYNFPTKTHTQPDVPGSILSAISKRLFSRGKSNIPETLDDDSAYASKDDSLVEDDAGNGQQPDVEISDSGTEKCNVDGQDETELLGTFEDQHADKQHNNNTNIEPASVKRVQKSRKSNNNDKDTLMIRTRAIKQPSMKPRKGPIGSNEKPHNKPSVGVSPITAALSPPIRDNEGRDDSISDEVIEQEAAPDEESLHNELDTSESQPRSSGRERRRPRRYSNEMVADVKVKANKRFLESKIIEAPVHGNHPPIEKEAVSLEIKEVQRPITFTPKGILTPSRRKKAGPRKSVVFDQSEKQIEENFGFRDIGHTTRKDKNSPISTGAVSSNDTPLSKEKAAQRVTTEPGLQKPFDITNNEKSDDLLDDSYDPHDTLRAVYSFDNQISASAKTDKEDHPCLTSIKSTVFNCITTTIANIPPYLSAQYSSLHSMLSATITVGESNSILLLGSRGARKSLMVETALHDLSSNYRDDFHTVRLNGFFQTDDKLALREIWRQLGREMQVSEDETGEVSSYADTMASLLSLLSHPEELNAEDNNADTDRTRETTKSIIFVLDEFDLFTTHPRQTLLYNLFDIAQSKKAPITVVGCSTRMDVVDCLEKRVKSRFSHRWLHVPSVKSLSSFKEILAGLLHVSESGAEAVGVSVEDLAWRARWNNYIDTTLLETSSVQACIARIFHTTKSIPDLLSALYAPIATISLDLDSDKGSEDANNTIVSVQSPPTLLSTLVSLPLLHLSLLIAASRLDTIHNLAALNFNLVYSHYTELIARTKLQRSAAGMVVATSGGLRLWNLDTAKMAWEDLGSWQLIVPVTGLMNNTSGQSAGGGDDHGDSGSLGGSRMWRVDISLEEVGWAVKEKLGTAGVGEIMGRWCREIIW